MELVSKKKTDNYYTEIINDWLCITYYYVDLSSSFFFLILFIRLYHRFVCFNTGRPYASICASAALRRKQGVQWQQAEKEKNSVKMKEVFKLVKCLK